MPGGHRLVQELIRSDLVDQINLMVFPVILGTGEKAFEETPERRSLRLRESRIVGDGVVVLIYNSCTAAVASPPSRTVVLFHSGSSNVVETTNWASS